MNNEPKKSTTELETPATEKKVPVIIELGDSDLDDVVGAYRCNSEGSAT